MENWTHCYEKSEPVYLVKFGDIQLLDVMTFVGGATSLDSFLKANKTSETKWFFPYDSFDYPDKIQNAELPSYDAFYSKLRSCKTEYTLETEYTHYVDRFKSGLTTGQAVINLKLSKPPPTGIENFQYLQQTWKKEQLSSFQDFLQWYDRKDIVPILEAMQKLMAFQHNEDIDMLKLGCTLPNLANICLHKFTDAEFSAFKEGVIDLSQKIREDVVGAPSIVFARKAFVDKTVIG